MRWSIAEVELLRELVKTNTIAGVAHALGRTSASVANKLQMVKLTTKRNAWSRAEITRLYALAETRSIRACATALGRSYSSVANKTTQLKISLKRNRLNLKQIAKILGTTSATVTRRRNKLGLDFRTSKKNHRHVRSATTRSATGSDIVALARDILDNPPIGRSSVTAKHLLQVIKDYEGWEP